MKPFDVFYSEEDAHRVRPLIRFLDLHDVALVEHTESAPERSDPYLVIVSEHFAEADWLRALLESKRAIAVRLTDADLPPKVRTLDLRSWPARSADRRLLSLAEWLRIPEQPASPFDEAQPEPSASQTERRQNAGALAIIALVVMGLVWVVLREPPPEEATDSATETEEIETELAAQGPGSPTATGSVLEITPSNLTDAPVYEGSIRSAEPAREAFFARYTCQRRWALGGAPEQCWVQPENFSWQLADL